VLLTERRNNTFAYLLCTKPLPSSCGVIVLHLLDNL